MIPITDLQKIGIGVTGFGMFFLFFGVILFFDKGLLAIGNGTLPPEFKRFLHRGTPVVANSSLPDGAKQLCKLLSHQNKHVQEIISKPGVFIPAMSEQDNCCHGNVNQSCCPYQPLHGIPKFSVEVEKMVLQAAGGQQWEDSVQNCSQPYSNSWPKESSLESSLES
ncbi:Vesicle transport protein GOT1A [Exaiptasia diaphana]|nr:Vesicle transport protein GOT1A [Exaiptasia diaphana]